MKEQCGRSVGRDDNRSADAAHFAARYVRVFLTCRACRHQRNADLQALVDAGRGDLPFTRLRPDAGPDASVERRGG
jgi:hypothetical protein